MAWQPDTTKGVKASLKVVLSTTSNETINRTVNGVNPGTSTGLTGASWANIITGIGLLYDLSTANPTNYSSMLEQPYAWVV